MKISVNINVRNSEWYWTKEEIEEAKKGHSMSREEWEMINEDKIPKYSESIDFEYTFEVKSYIDNRKGNYNLIVYASENDTLKENSIAIDDVTVIEFNGDTNTGFVVVSNELIHQFISARKGKGGRFYWYFYLKENRQYFNFRNIWLSEIHIEKIKNYLGERIDRFGIARDKNLKIRRKGGILS